MTGQDAPGAGTGTDVFPDPRFPYGPPWTYTVEHEAWYASIPGCVDVPELVIHHEAYKPTGARDGCEWQFRVRWITDRIRLDMDEFEDAVRLERPDLLDALEDLDAAATPALVVDLLNRLGFVDTTERHEPSFIPELPA